MAQIPKMQIVGPVLLRYPDEVRSPTFGDVTITGTLTVAGEATFESITINTSIHSTPAATERTYTFPDWDGQMVVSREGMTTEEVPEPYTGVPIEHNGTLLGVMFGLDDGTVGLAKLDSEGHYDPAGGSIDFTPSTTNLFGSVTHIESIKRNAGQGPGQVYTTETGELYTVDPPAPGWSVTLTPPSNQLVYIGDGTGEGDWVELTEVFILTPELIPSGERLDAYGKIGIINASTRSGEIQIGFSGTPGVEPTFVGTTETIAASFEGHIPFSITAPAASEYPIGTRSTVWVKQLSGSHNSFTVYADGTDYPHEFTLSGGGTSVAALAWDPISIPDATNANEVKDRINNLLAFLRGHGILLP